MVEHRIDYFLDDRPWHYMAQGILAESTNRQLAADDEDLIKNCTWHKQGYAVVKGMPDHTSKQLQSAVAHLVEKTMGETWSGKNIIPLENYHRLVNDSQHFSITKQLKNVPYIASDFFPLNILDELVSDALNIAVTSYNPSLMRHGCSIRMIRPQSTDYNPLHRDGWIDRLRHAVNVYIPIAGSNSLSSLSLIPHSHLWSESETQRTADGCIVNGKSFTVPSVVSSTHPLRMIRPPVESNEILIFSPYLIHGGAYNFNEDITRVSLEMRFWKKS